MLTYLCEKSSKGKMIKPHSVIYLKNYLFEEWNYIFKKAYSEIKTKSLIDIGSVWDSTVITDTPSSFANHWGLWALDASNAVPSACSGLTFLCQAARDILVRPFSAAISSDPQVLWHTLWVLLSWHAWKVVSIQVMRMKRKILQK